MYKSPIHIIYGQMKTQMEGTILKAVQNVGVNVDKEELLLALEYDRKQYLMGYEDGEADVWESIVRCKNCKHMEVTPDKLRWCNVWNGINGMGDEGFCNYGERKVEE